jgi:large subunit ribosomal protein L21
MYAVIETGGKQYRVELGSEIQVDRMDIDPGESIEIERVLLVADGDDASIGTPSVAGALVRADVVRQGRGEKIVVFKYKPKARRRVKQGHRADQTTLRISEISLNGRSAAKDAEKAQAEERRARREQEKEAKAQAAADKALADKLAAQAQAAEAAKAAAEAPAKGRTRRSTATAITGTTTDDAADAGTKPRTRTRKKVEPDAEAASDTADTGKDE